MKKANLVLVFILGLTACGPSTSPTRSLSNCQSILTEFYQLQVGEIPTYFEADNPVKQGGEIDVMDYFNVLDHLSMAPGIVLDYVYHFDGMGGYPILYARSSDQPPFATEADLPADSADSYLNYVQLDDTAESYFQYLVLATFGRQFYLFWHANYDDTEVICDRTDVNAIISDDSFGLSMPVTVKVRAALLRNLAPRVTFYEDTVEVRLVTFTKWGGFYEETYSLDRTSPTSILGVQRKNLIRYDCGIMF